MTDTFLLKSSIPAKKKENKTLLDQEGFGFLSTVFSPEGTCLEITAFIKTCSNDDP